MNAKHACYPHEFIDSCEMVEMPWYVMKEMEIVYHIQSLFCPQTAYTYVSRCHQAPINKLALWHWAMTSATEPPFTIRNNGLSRNPCIAAKSWFNDAPTQHKWLRWRLKNGSSPKEALVLWTAYGQSLTRIKSDLRPRQGEFYCRRVLSS